MQYPNNIKFVDISIHIKKREFHEPTYLYTGLFLPIGTLLRLPVPVIHQTMTKRRKRKNKRK